MAKIYYDDNEPAVPDYLAETVAAMVETHDIHTSSAAVLDAARMLIAEGKLNHEKVVFVIKGIERQADEFGLFQPHEWTGYPEYGLVTAKRLVRAMAAKRWKRKHEDT